MATPPHLVRPPPVPVPLSAGPQIYVTGGYNMMPSSALPTPPSHHPHTHPGQSSQGWGQVSMGGPPQGFGHISMSGPPMSMSYASPPGSMPGSPGPGTYYPGPTAGPPSGSYSAASVPKKPATVIKEGAIYRNDSAGWKRCWCVLTSDARLAFYPAKEQTSVHEKLVILNQTTVVKEVPQQPYISLEQQGESKFFINTSNATALKEWQTSIQDVVRKLKSQGDDDSLYDEDAPAPERRELPPPIPTDTLPRISPRELGRSQSLREKRGRKKAGSLGSTEMSSQLPRSDPSSESTPAADTPSNKRHNDAELAALREQIAKLTAQNEQLQSQLATLRRESQGSVLAPVPPRPGKSPSMQLIESAAPKKNDADFQKTGDGSIVVNLRNDPVEFHERLGGGGSGAQVFRCSVKGFSFAAKVLDMSHSAPSEIEPMLKEITIMTELKHDNIVRYIGSECNGARKEVRLYMELYSGTLRDVIDMHMEPKRPFTRKEITDYSLQIAKGLHYLHSLSIVHRDLKSDNIFVTWDGQKNPKTLRIGDFDVSKILDKGKIAFTQNVGTPGFIAPEVMSTPGEKASTGGHGPEADIWSYGMILYELLTLQRPYWDVDMLQVSAMNAAGVRPRVPESVDAEEMKDLLKLFKQCTNKKPTKRPSTRKILASLSRI